MARQFKTFKGKPTDIVHSSEYNKASFGSRKASAFNKDFLKKLSRDDKLIMLGYAQAKKEDQIAFNFKNPNYKRKTKPKTYNII